jgi:hypothetical protein
MCKSERRKERRQGASHPKQQRGAKNAYKLARTKERRLCKKGDKQDCKNYRGICLLNVTYKVFAKILYDRLWPHANAAVQHYQAGFQSGKSTTTQLFALRPILEKCNEFKIKKHHQFIDYKVPYAIIRNEVYVSISTSLQTQYTLPQQRSLLWRAASKYKTTVSNSLKPDKN